MRLTDYDKLQLKLRAYADKKAANGEIELANGILKAKCFIDQECEIINDKQLNGGWIPVSEGLPECEEEVLILTERNTITTAMYEDGKIPEDDSVWNWYEVDFNYDEENGIYCVPEGWWEYRHFNPDDVYNNAIDERVIAWQPLPQRYKEVEQ